MNAASRTPRPTDAELAILGVLWHRGPGTVRQVHEALSDRRDTGYTTTLKLMQIMTEKGLVRRDESHRSHVYTPAVSEDEIQRRLVDELADRAFAGSAQKLVMRALTAKPVTDEELAAIGRLLDELKGTAT